MCSKQVTIIANAYNNHVVLRETLNGSDAYNTYFQRTILSNVNRKRNSGIIDIFVFSKDFVDYPLQEDIVAGRPMIDSYLLSYTLSNGGSLIAGRYSCKS